MSDMSMKRMGTLFAIVFMLLPAFSHAATLAELQAQVQALMAQIATLQAQLPATTAAPQTGASVCQNLARNFFRGMRSSDVVQLQNFLVSQNLLAADSATGFFGAITERAVQQWQTRNGIVSGGSPATTGYGVVGRRTRTAIVAVCTQRPTQPVDGIHPATPPVTYNPPSVNPPQTPVQTSPVVSTCTSLPLQTQTLACPAGQTGSITQTRTSSCAASASSPMWSAWSDTNNTCVTPVSASPATLSQYWVGQAEWKIDRKLIYDKYGSTGWPAGYGEGSQIVVGGDGSWYLFHRHVYNTLDTASMTALWGANTETDRKKCGFNGSIIGTDVRKSIDHGATWSGPRPVVWPAKGSPWECMGGDGGAYYDAMSNSWQYLFQCLRLEPDRSGVHRWGGCHVTFNGADPVTGPNVLWDVVPAAAISIEGGDLWSRLCSNSNSSCAKLHAAHPAILSHSVENEGNFDIFDHKFLDGQWWWMVTMDGFDNVLGYRGLFKTTDFINWKVGSESSDLPIDTIGDPYTASNWNETWQGWTDGAGGTLLNQPLNIGAGGGRMIKEGDYYYEVLEVADKNLVCVAGQNWDIGILRSNNLANSIWEQLPSGNPIFRSAVEAPGLPCSISYSNIFRDKDGTVYLHQHIGSTDDSRDGIYIYKLVKK